MKKGLGPKGRHWEWNRTRIKTRLAF